MYRILQVDDEEMILDLTSRFLGTVLGTEEEFSFRSESDVALALGLLNEERFDAIISDYQMPGMDGIGFLKQVRLIDQEVPFLLFTGKGREEVAMEALNNGADFYVQKGGDPSAQFGELAHKLRQAIAIRRSRAQLRESERRLVQAQHLAKVGSWTLSAESNDLDLSAEMYRICGLIPSSFDHRLMTFIEQIHPEDREDFRDMINTIWDSRRSASLQFRLIWSKGEIRHLSMNMEPVLNGQGQLIELTAAISDVTDFVRSQEALQESEARWKFALEGAGDGVFDYDLRKDVLYRSRKYLEVLGHRDDEPIASLRWWEDSLHPDDRVRATEELRKYLEGKIPAYMIEYRERCQDGSYKWILSRGKVVARDKKGQPLRLVGIHTDITERKAMESALKDANSKLKILSSITRHDLLNQLSVVEGTVSLLARGEEDEERRQHLARMDRAIDNMARVIKFTKDYESMGANGPVWQAAQTVWGSSIAKFDLPRVAVTSALAGLSIYADPMLEKVFFNLIDNSLRHGGQVTSIDISHRTEGDVLLLVYRDDGRGVPSKEKESIFEMGCGGNTGLGMFLSRAVLGITGVRIEEVGEPGQGAVFVLRVPPGSYRFEADGTSVGTPRPPEG